MSSAGKFLVLAGAIIIIIGIILWLGGEKINWLGKLPGDIRIEKENFKIFFPITTMLLLSIIISLIVKLVQKFF